MRWVFIALVLANVGVFIWHSVESSRMERLEALNTTSDVSQGVISGAPLVLVSELSEEEKRELMKVREAPAVTEVSAEASVSVAPVATPSGEPAKAAAPLVPSASDQSALEGTPIVGPDQCLKIGPLPNAMQAEQVSQRLMAVAIITDMIEVDVPGKPEYWVILPPFSDEKTALQKLQELQGRAISAQIIPKGELANAISFGLHGQKEDAIKQADAMTAKGYRAQVKEVPVKHKEKWLALSERQAPKLTEELWRAIHADFPKLDKQIKNCH